MEGEKIHEDFNLRFRQSNTTMLPHLAQSGFEVYKVYKTFEGIADMVMIHDLLISEACREHYKGASDHRDGTLNTSRR